MNKPLKTPGPGLLLRGGVLTAMLFLAGCGSAPPPVQPSRDISASIDREVLALEESRELIRIGGYSSITEALDLLRVSGAGNTERGRELEFVGRSLLQMVYPLLAGADSRPIAPRFGSEYSELFERLRAGVYPEEEEYPNTPLFPVLRLTAFFFSEDPEVVEKVYADSGRLLEAQPDLLLPRLCRGLILLERGLYGEAEENLLRVLEADADSHPALTGLSRLYIETLNRSSAEGVLNELLSRFPENREILGSAVKGYITIESFQQADRVVADALAKYPEDLQLLAGRAIILERFGRDEQARRLLRVIEGRKGDTGDTYYLRIRLAMKAGDFPSAFSLIAEAENRYPDDRRFQELYGNLLFQAGRLDEARAYLSDILEHQPENVFSLELLMKESMEAERWGEALEHLEVLLDLRDSDEYLRSGVAIHSALENQERAFELAEVLYNRNPEAFSHFSLYIEQMIAAGLNGEALRLIDQRLTGEQNAERRSELFYLKSLLQQEREEKLNSLRQALFENLKHIRSIIAIAEVYESMGEYRQAARYLRQALALEPDNQGVIDGLRRMEELSR